MKVDYLFSAVIGGLTVLGMIAEPTSTVISQGIMIFCLLTVCLLKQAMIVELKKKLGVE